MTCKDCIYRAMCYKIEHYGYGLETEEPCEMFKNKADYAEVKHGKWLITDSFDHHKTPIYQCSACRKEVADGYIQFHKHCLHCGTKMDGMNLSDIPTGSEGSSDNEQSI